MSQGTTKLKQEVLMMISNEVIKKKIRTIFAEDYKEIEKLKKEIQELKQGKLL